MAITLRVDEQTAARFVAYCATKKTSQAQAFTAWVRRLPNVQMSDPEDNANQSSGHCELINS